MEIISQHLSDWGIPVLIDNIPLELRTGYWCVWRAFPRKGRPGKVDKIPYNYAGRISTAQPAQWLTFAEAVDLYRSGGYNGLGKLCVAGEGLIYVDPDQTTDWAAWQQRFETYCELSPSRNGLRQVGLGTITRDITQPVEIYAGHAPRFVTMTGHMQGFYGVADIGAAAQAVVDQTPAPLETPVDKARPEILAMRDEWPELRLNRSEGEQSEELMGLANQLYRRGYTDQEALSILAGSPAVWELALRHREDNEEKARAYLWGRCQKARIKIQAEHAARVNLLSSLGATGGGTADADAGKDSDPASVAVTLEDLEEEIRSLHPGSSNDQIRSVLIKGVGWRALERNDLISRVASATNKGIQIIKAELNGLRDEVRNQVSSNPPKSLQEVCEAFVFVAELNRFFRPDKRSFLTIDAFRNNYCHLVEEVDRLVLARGMVPKADRVDYYPGQPRLFQEDGVLYVNAWTGIINRGRPGDCGPWLNHFKLLGLSDMEIKHFQQQQAFTLVHPEEKINHALVFVGPEGSGKDFLLTPVDRALAENSIVTGTDILFRDFNGQLKGVKQVRFNETMLGGHRDAERLENKLKPLCAAPPDRLEINEKGVPVFYIRNLINVVIVSNSDHPLHIGSDSRRYFPVKTEVRFKDEQGNMPKQWKEYWTRLWAWMNNGGWEHCVHYLMNEVDLSDFNPGLMPEATEFKREIQEASKDCALQALEDLMEEGKGLFGHALVTAADLHREMRLLGEGLLSQYDMRRLPSVQQVSSLMKKVPGVWLDDLQYRDAGGKKRRQKLWVVQEPENYRVLPPEEKAKLYTDLMKDYVRSQEESSVYRPVTLPNV